MDVRNIVVCYLICMNINEARKTWNEYSNIVKFKVDKEGNYTNQVVERM